MLSRPVFGWLLACVFLLVCSFSPTAAAESISVTLTNGDRLSGILISDTAERVTLRSAVAGKVRIPADQIRSKEYPDRPKPAPVAASGTNAVPAVAAKPAPAPAASAPGVAKPATPPPAGSTLTNAVAQKGLQRIAPDWLDPFMTNWHGNVQIGLDLGYGTTDRQTYYANASASHSYGRIRNFADLHAAYGFLNNVQSAERIDGSWKLDIDLGEKRRLYVYEQAGAGYDRIRKLDRQFQEGVGLGYKILQRDKMVLSGEAGGQFQYLDYSKDVTTADRHIISVRLGESLTWNIAGKLNLTQRAAVMPNVEDFGDFRMRFELGLSYPLFKRMTINLNLMDDYDSSPPAGVDSNELQLQSTLGITF